MIAELKKDNFIERLAAQIAWQDRRGVQVAVLDMASWPRTDKLLPLLPLDERAAAGTMSTGLEQDHYVRRRVFQRLFVKQVLDLKQSPGEVPLHHAPDQRPYCPAALDLCLSFSTAGDTAVAAASAVCTIGVDVERLRSVPDVLALAGRFFGEREAREIRNAPLSQQPAIFLRLWSAKEACLKAFGTGVVQGLEQFQFTLQNKALKLASVPPGVEHKKWSVEELHVSEAHVAVLAKCMKN